MIKKLRKIVVNGHSFHWRASWSYVDEYRIIHLRIWAGEKISGPLAVNLTSKWLSAYPTDSSYPHPKDVEIALSYGLAHGWTPAVQRTPFWLTENMPGLAFEHLLVTDFGRIADTPPPLVRMQVFPQA
jgi:hypothetical protein